MRMPKLCLRSLFTIPPAAPEELFRNIKCCTSIFEPERLQNLKPAPEEDIQALEALVMEKYGRPIPLSFRQYLTEMGTEDGGILSRHMGEEWRGGQNGLNTASLTKIYIEYKFRMGRGFEDVVQDRSPGCPPFWNFFYAPLAERTYGFSPCTDDPDELVHSDAWRFYYPQYTFSKLLFYCAYSDLLRWVLTNGKDMKYKAGTFSSGYRCIHGMTFLAWCPPEWTVTGHAPLAEFLCELEDTYSLEPCWFSNNKEFCLYDLNRQPTDEENLDVRYVAFHKSCGLTLCIAYYTWYKHQIRVTILSEDLSLTKQISDAILEQSVLEENTMDLKQLDWRQVPDWLTFSKWW